MRNRFQCLSKSAHAQQGAVLIVSLVILLVISLLGVANMQSSSSDLKMAVSHRDRDVAFAAAEAALVAAEDWLEGNKPTMAQRYSSCSGDDCFNTSCSSGLCFEGLFQNISNPKTNCNVGPTAGTQRIEFWSDSALDVWSEPAKHKTVAVDGFDNAVKYIVEFLCYVPVDDDDPISESTVEPLYRITAFASGNGDRARVMLQSTYLLVE